MRSVLALVGVAGVLVACGGSTSSDGDGKGNGGKDASAPPVTTADAAAPPVTGDAGGGLGTPDAGAIDATAPAVDSGSDDTYPAAHPPIPLMTDFGGGVIANPHVITVTFVGNAERDATRTFNEAIIQSDYWTAVTRGYGIAKGTHEAVELPDTLAGKTLDNDNDLKPWIAQMVTAGSLPAPDANTLYAIYFTASTHITLLDGGQTVTSCSGYGGFHDSAPVNLASGSTIDAAYAVLPSCGGGVSDDTATHEFIEAVTDPHPASKLHPATYYMWDDAWSLMGVQGGEVADNCQGRGSFTTPDGHKVARSYVNAAAKESKDPCQPTDPGKIYFGAAPVTETQHYTDPQDSTNDHDSGDYILLKEGETKDVDVTIFSEAKLPHDLTIVAGQSKQGATDPTQVVAIAPGVATKLSATTAHNGQHITMTLTAAANASQGDHPFVVRAVLEQNDYHSWWVILRVTK